MVGVDQAREKTEPTRSMLVRNSPVRVDQAPENPWIMLVGNDTYAWLRHFQPVARVGRSNLLYYIPTPRRVSHDTVYHTPPASPQSVPLPTQ